MTTKSDAELRTEFEANARNQKHFKLCDFRRFKEGDFVELAAESGFAGYKLGLEQAACPPIEQGRKENSND